MHTQHTWKVDVSPRVRRAFARLSQLTSKKLQVEKMENAPPSHNKHVKQTAECSPKSPEHTKTFQCSLHSRSASLLRPSWSRRAAAGSRRLSSVPLPPSTGGSQKRSPGEPRGERVAYKTSPLPHCYDPIFFVSVLKVKHSSMNINLQ